MVLLLFGSRLAVELIRKMFQESVLLWLKPTFTLEGALKIMPRCKLGWPLPVEINLLSNTKCMVFEVYFFCQIVKKLEFTHFFAV